MNYIPEGNTRHGERFSLPKLAAKLDVSVISMREALTQITEIGIITYKTNGGFFVTDLSQHETKEIYQLIALLESETIKAASYRSDHLKKLPNINNAPQSLRNIGMAQCPVRE